MREDVVTNEARPEDAVANAPEHEDGLFVVPSIIE
jgi:aspartyl/glutamyl-tRNA(Asn/Gln) amidotransferase C subunit